MFISFLSFCLSIFFSFVFPLVAAMNNFMQFYSQPFGAYLLPGYTFKRKGGQVRFTQHQTQNLEKQFINQKYLSPEHRKQLAIQLKLSDRQVTKKKKENKNKWR